MRQTGNDNLIWYVSSKYGFEVRILLNPGLNLTILQGTAPALDFTAQLFEDGLAVTRG